MSWSTWWDASDDPMRMLDLLNHTRNDSYDPRRHLVSDRRLRLFACACARQVWHLLTTEVKCRLCLGVPGLMACPGCEGRGKYNYCRRMIVAAEQMTDGYHGIALADVPGERTPEETYVRTVLSGADLRMAHSAILDSPIKTAVLASLLREVFGDPSLYEPCGHCVGRLPGRITRPCRLCGGRELLTPSWCTPMVQRLAYTTYISQDQDRFPVLTDALRKAGCTNDRVLYHLENRERCLNCSDRPGLMRLYPADQLPGSLPFYGTCWKCDSRSTWNAFQPGFQPGDPGAIGSGWVALGVPHVKGCWVIDLLANQR